MTVERVKPLADGRIYSGNQALGHGLVDQLGDSVDATKLAAELGGIKDEKPRVRRDSEIQRHLRAAGDARATDLRSGTGGRDVDREPSIAARHDVRLVRGW